MKRVLIIVLLSLSVFGFSQAVNPVAFTTPIKAVKVYLNGADVYRSGSLKLKKGRNEIIISELSQFLDGKSIRPEFDKDITIVSLSCSFEKVFVDPTSEQRDLVTKIEANNRWLELTMNQIFALTKEKEMILENMSISGDAGVTLENLQAVSVFFKDRLLKNAQETTELKIKEIEQKEAILRLNESLKAAGYLKTKYTREISMIVDVDNETDTKLELVYFVSNAGWLPTYDVKVLDLSGKINLVYKAKVKNKTEEDWTNVEMVISTGDPRLSATQPSLSTWRLNYSPYASSTVTGLAYNEAETFRTNGFLGDVEGVTANSAF